MHQAEPWLSVQVACLHGVTAPCLIVGVRCAFTARCHLFVVAPHEDAVDGFNVWCGEAFQRNLHHRCPSMSVGVSSLIYSLILMKFPSSAVLFGSFFIPSVVMLREKDLGRVRVGTKIAPLTTQETNDNGSDGRAAAGVEFAAHFDSTLLLGSGGGGAWAFVGGVIGHGSEVL